MNLKSILIVSALAFAAAASAQMRITEWMYNNTPEYVELTNVGSTSVDMSGWSFSDNHRVPGSFSLSDFGTVKAGESVLFTEASASDFRTLWGLNSSVKVLGGNAQNLGRGDEINIYDSTNALIDQLTYDDSKGLGPRTQDVSGNFGLADLGKNNANLAVLSKAGDAYGSWANTSGQVGNPGKYSPVPEPASMLAIGLGAFGVLRRRAKK